MKSFLLKVLQTRVDAKGGEWLEKALRAGQAPLHLNTLLGNYTGASRRMGKRALMLNGEEAAKAASLVPGLTLDHWGADEAARALLLLSVDHLPADEYADVVVQCYENGDSREQEGWCRSLPILPGCNRFLETAVDACRTNIIPLFESIACENPYPHQHFPELNFNQLVMKALFNFLALDRIVGLEERVNPDLSRMCNDYVSEREAAGRAVPSDIWLALVPHIPVAELPRVAHYLGHKNPDHRFWAAVALGSLVHDEARNMLQARVGAEQDARVKSALEVSLVKQN